MWSWVQKLSWEFSKLLWQLENRQMFHWVQGTVCPQNPCWQCDFFCPSLDFFSKRDNRTERQQINTAIYTSTIILKVTNLLLFEYLIKPDSFKIQKKYLYIVHWINIPSYFSNQNDTNKLKKSSKEQVGRDSQRVIYLFLT